MPERTEWTENYKVFFVDCFCVLAININIPEMDVYSLKQTHKIVFFFSLDIVCNQYEQRIQINTNMTGIGSSIREIEIQKMLGILVLKENGVFFTR